MATTPQGINYHIGKGDTLKFWANRLCTFKPLANLPYGLPTLPNLQIGFLIVEPWI